MRIIDIPLLRTLPPHFPPTRTHTQDTPARPPQRLSQSVLRTPSTAMHGTVLRGSSPPDSAPSTMHLPLLLNLPISGLCPHRIRYTSSTRTTPTLVFLKPSVHCYPYLYIWTLENDLYRSRSYGHHFWNSNSRCFDACFGRYCNHIPSHRSL